ncbi:MULTISPECIES: CBO0543 family protein [Bacillaceae]|uniref:Uncharacterized protein n=1 Tax=Evansella alkalicola TaxID=745819 RepID=A0ABS6JWF2_9BACI|nr:MULTISPECIES: CBO0543 family protein [Bacillaceae]MBU9722401.1 hypothetical protein [Bacillus alkalicola]
MRYPKEKTIITGSWIGTSLLLYLFVPKGKFRNAQIPFLFTQFLTWLLGLLVTEKKLIRYPVRIFKYASKNSFSFEYFILPALTAMFNMRYPQSKGVLVKGLYYFVFTGSISALEYYALKRTDLIKYNKWKWSWSFISLWITFFLSRKYYVWFFKYAKK